MDFQVFFKTCNLNIYRSLSVILRCYNPFDLHDSESYTTSAYCKFMKNWHHTKDVLMNKNERIGGRIRFLF